MNKLPEFDPLYIIFEHHLLNFQDSSANKTTFVNAVIKDYLQHVRKIGMIVPNHLEAALADELKQQIGLMLLKRIYGFIKVEDYQKKSTPTQKRQAKAKYKRLRATRSLSRQTK